MIIVYRYRVKSLNGLLNKQAKACNFVWNFCNDTQKHALKWQKKWPTGFDLNKLTAGSCKELGLLSGTVNAVCEQYAKSRSKKNSPYLRYRGKRSLGWIPIKGRELKRNGDNFKFAKKKFRVFNSRKLPDGKIKDGTNFSCDARGRWYLNIVIEIKNLEVRKITKTVGVDLGMKDFATLSTGEKIENPKYIYKMSKRLSTAQRANKRKQVRNIHAKIINSRRDFLHKLSTRLVKEFDFIAVGKINSSGLAKTRMSKSVFDASWSSFRNMLRYKAIGRGAEIEDVDERFTTQSCSNCGSLPDSRPKGIAGLGIRVWTCDDCNVVHDRDVNASRNILSKSRYGHVSLDVGTCAI